MTVNHQCAASGCVSVIPTKFLFCRSHWRQLSNKLREQVNAWLALYSKETGNEEAFSNYQAARFACIKHIEDKEAAR